MATLEASQQRAPSATDRILDWVGGDDPTTLAVKGLWLRRFVFAFLAVESWFRYATETAPNRIPGFTFALLFTLCLALGWFPRFAHSAAEIVAVTVLAEIVWWFPHTANHLYLEGVVALMLALFDPRSERENALLMRGLRWLPVIVLLWSGVKKLVYGYYFDATFFGQMIGFDARFKEFFRLLLPAEEHLRLVRQWWPGHIGDGPFAVNSPLVVAMSNAAWLLEILLPLGLLVRPLRRAAMIGTILLVIAIELAAREVFFGALFTNLLLLYAPRDLNRKLFPVYLLFFAWVLLIAAGAFARWSVA